jgi:phage replication-related protein YjqB (UPF0714/DUF867 family)
MIQADTLESYNVGGGEQVRLSAPAASAAYESVLRTVPDDVFDAGTWNCTKACRKLDVASDSELAVQPFAPHPEYTTREQAKEHDEFVEYLEDSGGSDLVVTAPHGGRIEYKTDAQSRLVADALGATDWGCFGFNSGGGAYDRWHITSTEISPRSFPKLGEIADRNFAYGVSFHGFGEDGIAVGGGASQELKRTVCQAIEGATDERYDVYIPDTDGPYAGVSSTNYVNWLTADGDGIQIEQSLDARKEDWQAVANAVVSVFD